MTEIFTHPDNKFCYVPLLKNAHMWGEKLFSELGFFKEKYIFDNNKIYIIFLRDPIDRWLSGTAEYLQLLKIDNDFEKLLDNNFKLDKLHLNFIFNKIEFDPHTQGQFRYIREYNPKLEHGRCIYFYMDNNFSENVAQFVFKNFNKKISKDPCHTIKSNSFKMNIRNQLERELENNKIFKKNVDNYFQEDYDFIRRCAFYNSNKSGL